MKTLFLYFTLLVMSISSLYGQDQELSEEQYAILNLELLKGKVYQNTNFAYYWSNYLNLEWLSSQDGFCIHSKENIFNTSDLPNYIDNETLASLSTMVTNQQGPLRIEAAKLKKLEVKLVTEYDSNMIRYVSAPIIKGNFAVLLDRDGWIEKIIFFKKTEKGAWEKFCEVYVLLMLVGY